jgi:hypothetical protein
MKPPDNTSTVQTTARKRFTDCGEIQNYSVPIRMAAGSRCPAGSPLAADAQRAGDIQVAGY